jgi:acyl-CoA synthetase (AMP-forming)/AMP-acid ligase II
MKNFFRVALSLGVLAALVLLERKRPLRRERESKLRRNSRNLTVAALGALTVHLLEAPVVRPLARSVEQRKLGLLKQLRLPRPLEIIAAVILMDYTLYLWHVLTHRVPFLWRFHAVNNVDLALDASQALPVHFDERPTTPDRHRATDVIIVGQAFARPILDALEATPGKYDLSSLALIVSSGAMWGQESKEDILRHIPQALVFDSYGSSEAIGLGGSVSGANDTEQTARFAIGPRAGVFTEDGRRVEPGSGEKGLVSVGGFIPLGYYKDEAKTAATFRTFEGRRWSVPGDWATVNEDGTVNLLGRGSLCINTGGEKVFPEEVEIALRTHPAIRDAVAVGIPNNRFGEAVCAIVETEGGATVTLPDINEYVKSKLAAYKAPRHLVVVDTIGRAPNGKVDYRKLKRAALERLGA